MNRLLLWMWFAHCFPTGSVKPTQVLTQCGDLESFYADRARCLENYPFLQAADAHRILSAKPDDFRGLADLCSKKGMQIVTYEDDLFPQRLRQIDNPPMILYYYGDLSSLSRPLCMAVVGTRSCIPYSKTTAQRLSEELALRGVTIVSCLLYTSRCV